MKKLKGLGIMLDCGSVCRGEREERDFEDSANDSFVCLQ